MADDWIKMRTDLYRDPQVLIIADHLASDCVAPRRALRNAVVGALVTVWGVARKRGERDGDDLIIENASISIIDDIADLEGFGRAMLASRWLEETEKGLVFPRFFAKHNADPSDNYLAKNRDRQRRFRDKKRNATSSATGDDVTPQSRVEESREEKNTKDTPKPPKSEPKIPSDLDTEGFRKSWSEWNQHRRAKDAKGWTHLAQVKSMNKLATVGVTRAIAAIEHSIANGYTGIYEPDQGAKRGNNHRAADRAQRRSSEFAQPDTALPEL